MFAMRPPGPSRCSRAPRRTGTPSRAANRAITRFCRHSRFAWLASMAFLSMKKLPATTRSTRLARPGTWIARSTHIIDPALDDDYPLLAMDAAGVRPNLSAAVYARLIASRQRPDGHWVTVDQRPPQSYSYITATAVSLRAIQLFGHRELAAETRQRVQRARAWLASQQPRDTEERTYQLLGLHWAGASAGELAKLGRDLVATQRPDGGWNSLDPRPAMHTPLVRLWWPCTMLRE
jgi:hypothetical protein